LNRYIIFEEFTNNTISTIDEIFNYGENAIFEYNYMMSYIFSIGEMLLLRPDGYFNKTGNYIIIQPLAKCG